MRMRTVLSKKNPYWISRHRFLELYHFSLQYDDWKKELSSIVLIPDDPGFDPTGETAVRIEKLKRKIELVERCCLDADSGISKWIKMGVTRGMSYDTLRTREHIPCGKEYYFTRYRKYFWLLSQRS